MAQTKEIPEQMIELGGTPWHDRILESDTINRCKAAFEKINYEDWPVERTCLFFGVSSSWYRIQAMRYGLGWNEKIIHEHKIREVYKEFQDRIKHVLDINDEWDMDAFIDVLLESPIEHKAITNDDDEWIDLTPITNEDILSLKDAMIVERKVLDERNAKIDERKAQEAKDNT